MNALAKLLLAAAAIGMSVAAAHASDLRASPVVIEPLPGARSANFTLINVEDRPIRVQIRVMRWAIVDGKEVLTPTNDLVASPPMASLNAQQHYLVRLVRTAKAPPVGEESYRLLVDEIPDQTIVKPGNVRLVLRLSIPVFFSDEPNRKAEVTWAIQHDTAGDWLVGRNTGTRRMRLSDLSVEAGGTTLFRWPGLVGYVLASSEMRWALPVAVSADAKVEIKATADAGKVEVALATGPGA